MILQDWEYEVRGGCAIVSAAIPTRRRMSAPHRSWFADFPASLRVLEDVDFSSWLNPANDHIRNARIEDTEW